MTFFESGQSCRSLYCYLNGIRYCWRGNMQKSHCHTCTQSILPASTLQYYKSAFPLQDLTRNFTPDEEVKRIHANVHSHVKWEGAAERLQFLFKLKPCFSPVWPVLGNSLYNFLFYRNKSTLKCPKMSRSGANKNSDLKRSEVKICKSVLLTTTVRAALLFFSL